MATYKKKGQKKIKNAPVDKIEEESTTAEVFKNLEENASISEKWLEKNQKPLFTGFLVIVVSILGYLAYNNYIVEPKESEAANELAFPRASFEQAVSASVAIDSMYTVALEGTNGKYGFVDIADKFSGTKAGNLANYYAGISYLKIKQYDKAIAHLENFSSNDAMLAPTALGAIGDAFADLEQAEEALAYYEKAANAKKNNATTPLYLFKAANTALDLGKKEKAITYFTEIKETYNSSSVAKNIEMHINKAKYSN